MKQESGQRLTWVDFLKTVGMAAILLAHVSPPPWLRALRCFDVPLMVILSSLLGARSWRKCRAEGKPAASWLLARVRRLVVPVWSFLTFYFLLELVRGRSHTPGYYVWSYLLTRYGIGYVWVILIYLYSAFWVPFFARDPLSRWAPAGMAALYLLYEAACLLEVGMENRIVLTTVYYLIPYGAVTLLGCTEARMSYVGRWRAAAVSLAVFAALGVYFQVRTGAFLDMNEMKYPPRLYFLAWGAGISFLLIAICRKHPSRMYEARIVRFVSRHSMGIYLWHILMLDLYDDTGLPDHWALRFLAVSAGAALAAWLVDGALEKAGRKFPVLRALRG